MSIGKRQFGFTLIELLVVVSIIAVLLAVLVPSLVRVRETSKRIVCLNNLKQQSIALTQYSQDYGGCYPWEARSSRPQWT